MLSPIPTRQEVGAPLASPGELLPSPVGWPLSSPHFGRTPGAYVVQEGRLSLEMFTGGETEDGRPGLRGSVDLFTGVAGTAHPAGAGQHKGEAQLQPASWPTSHGRCDLNMLSR